MTTLAELYNEEKISADEFMCLLFRIEPGTLKFDDENSKKDWPWGAALIYGQLTRDIKAKKLSVSLEDGKLLKSELEKWQSKYRRILDSLNVAYLINAEFRFLSKEWLTKKPPEPEFCVNPLVPIGAVTLINAHGGTGKSIFALKMAIHIALGLPIIGAETNGGKVAYMSLEDSANIVQNRIYKIFKALPEKQQLIDELTTKIAILDRYGLPTYMAEKQYGNIITPPIAQWLSSSLKKYQIKCLFVDTLIRTNPLNENDNTEMGRLLVTYEGIARDAECGVVLIHHLPKVSVNRSYSARGASAITDNVRSALLLRMVQKNQTLIEVTHTKHNYSAEHPKQYLEMTKDGILLEVSTTSLPTTTSANSDSDLYKQLYECWVKVWQSRPLSKNHIEKNVKDIKLLAKTTHGRTKYASALNWAIKNGFAEKAPTPKGGKPDVKFYTLKALKTYN